MGTKVVFARAFEVDFSFTLRERRSPTLEKTHTYALDIEANMTVVGKVKGK